MSIKNDVEIAELQGKVAGLERTVEALKELVIEGEVPVTGEYPAGFVKKDDVVDLIKRKRKQRSDKGKSRR